MIASSTNLSFPLLPNVISSVSSLSPIYKQLNNLAEDLLTLEDTFVRYLSHLVRARHQLLYNAEISKQLRQCDAEIILDFKMCGVTTYMLFGFYLFLKQEAAPT
jgi:hypothetical protein